MSVSVDPATGRTIATHVFADAATVDALLDRAVVAQRDWAATPVAARAAILRAIGAALRNDAEPLAQTITAEMGKPIVQARAEVEKCAGLCDWYADHGPARLADEAVDVGGDGTATLCWQPMGVVYGVMPWNFPLWQALRAAVPILLAGNNFILKHADNVQLSAKNLVLLTESAGLPPGVLTNLHLPLDRVAAIVADRRIAAVTVTSGVAAGAAIAAAAGAALKKAVLELGGIDAFVVLADADLDAAADAAIRSRFLNGGQVCIACKRIIVERAVIEDFTRRFVDHVALAIVTWSMNNYGLLNWYPAMMMRSFAMTPAAVAASYGPAFMIGGIAGCFAVAPSLRLLRRFDRDGAPFLLCLTTMALLALTTAIGPLMPSAAGVTAMAFVNLFVSSMTVASVFVLIVAVVPPHLRAIYTGLYMALVNLTGGAFGSVLVGLITDHLVGTASLNLSLAIMALSFGPLSSVLMFFAYRRWRLQPRSAALTMS